LSVEFLSTVFDSLLTDPVFNMRVRGLDGIEKVIQMRRNDRDFPTVEWVKGTSGWQKTECVMTDVI
jgi:hypothetical protein